MRKIFPLLSGGVDSTIATLKRLSNINFKEVHPIFINYGQRACEQEWKSVRNVSERIVKLTEGTGIVFHNPKRIDLSFTSKEGFNIFEWSKSQLITGDSHGDPYVENRNMILLSVASSYAESQLDKSEEGIIVTGFRDEWPDTQREFVAIMNCVLTFLLSDKEKMIRIEAPIIDYGPQGKTKMVEDFKQHREIINLTWSCYNPNPVTGEPCNRCKACKDRKQALP